MIHSYFFPDNFPQTFFAYNSFIFESACNFHCYFCDDYEDNYRFETSEPIGHFE